MTFLAPENCCTGCMACVNVCPNQAVSIKDSIMALNAIIDETVCICCNRCRQVCPELTHVKLKEPLRWVQGWANEENIRSVSASGGFATAISKAFIANGGVVCSCVFKNGQFIFETIENINEIEKFCGSKYVKSNPFAAYSQMKYFFKQGKKVLFIGLPCQSAGIINTFGQTYGDCLYTIDLVCHGTPSVQVLDCYLYQHNVTLDTLTQISFRCKKRIGLNFNSSFFLHDDTYTFAFLHALDYTENCYRCRYAQQRRAADITLGDSWGSVLPEGQNSNWGISLALCQTEKGSNMLEQTDLAIYPVDQKLAVQNNDQLRGPSKPHKCRDAFIKGIQKNRNFDRMIVKYFPKETLQYFKKLVLQKLRHE